MITGSIARRYARALFGLAEDKGLVEPWLDALTALEKAVGDSTELRDALGNPKFQKIKVAQNTYNLPKYGETIFIKISSRSSDVGQISPVSLVVTRPDGIRTEYTIPVLQSGSYSTSIPLNHDSPIGTYEIIAYHVGKELAPYYFDVQKNSIIPSWMQSSVRWWAEGKISDSEFLSGIQYLIEKKILVLDVVDATKIDPGLDVSIHGQKAVRRGTTQNLDIHVENFEGNVGGATVFVHVENYGEDILEEFKGETDSDGNYSISWELSTDYTDIETFLVYVDVTDGMHQKPKCSHFKRVSRKVAPHLPGNASHLRLSERDERGVQAFLQARRGLCLGYLLLLHGQKGCDVRIPAWKTGGFRCHCENRRNHDPPALRRGSRDLTDSRGPPGVRPGSFQPFQLHRAGLCATHMIDNDLGVRTC